MHRLYLIYSPLLLELVEIPLGVRSTTVYNALLFKNPPE